MATATPPATAHALLSPSQVAELLPAGRGCERPHPATVIKWIRDGVTGANGDRVYLRARRLGGRWLVSRDSVDEFLAALAPHRGRRP